MSEYLTITLGKPTGSFRYGSYSITYLLRISSGQSRTACVDRDGTFVVALDSGLIVGIVFTKQGTDTMFKGLVYSKIKIVTHPHVILIP